MQNQQRQEDDDVESLVCPSFNSYSTGEVAGIAERIRREQLIGAAVTPNDAVANDFEFITFRKAADGVFFDESVGPVFPVFDRDILLTAEDGGDGDRESNADDDKEDDADAEALQFPMRKLLIGDVADRDPPSSSSSEADDLDAIPPGTYCVWTPKSAKPSPGRCKKSNSTGSSSSKKWKLLDLLRRSHSDGKDSFVFLTPSSSSSSSTSSASASVWSSLGKKKEARVENSKDQSSKVAGKPKAKGIGISGDGGEKKVSAHEAFYVRNRELKKGDKRKSYLPYRQDLVGFFANVNSMSKAFPPF